MHHRRAEDWSGQHNFEASDSSNEQLGDAAVEYPAGHELQNTATVETKEHQRLLSTRKLELARDDVERVMANRPVFVTLRKLLRAYRYAKDCSRSRWDFAVEISELRRLQVSNEDLRWLIAKELVDQAEEQKRSSGTRRKFAAAGGFSLSEESCFVLTDFGLAFSQYLAGIAMGNETMASAELNEGNVRQDDLALPNVELLDTTLPVWDVTRHELSLGGKLVKKFKWRAANQEAILSAFAEEGWPARIDDPLPPIAEMDPKRRLSDTIKCLNRHHVHSLLRFCGDGSGEGVVWERVDRR